MPARGVRLPGSRKPGSHKLAAGMCDELLLGMLQLLIPWLLGLTGCCSSEPGLGAHKGTTIQGLRKLCVWHPQGTAMRLAGHLY